MVKHKAIMWKAESAQPEKVQNIAQQLLFLYYTWDWIVLWLQNSEVTTSLSGGHIMFGVFNQISSEY